MKALLYILAAVLMVAGSMAFIYGTMSMNPNGSSTPNPTLLFLGYAGVIAGIVVLLINTLRARSVVH